MPPADAAHPLLRQDRDAAARFAGSWSVRLTGDGYHSAHHHPQGWLSGVLYIEVPEMLSGLAGHLWLGGGPENLGLEIAPLRTVEPKPGRLVLLPSCMWHGTNPSIMGERVTIAFDMIPKRLNQSVPGVPANHI
nr:putative 2OG-Fe(II) oxygenase [Hephaestia mangrovi]